MKFFSLSIWIRHKKPRPENLSPSAQLSTLHSLETDWRESAADYDFRLWEHFNVGRVGLLERTGGVINPGPCCRL